MDLQGSVPEPSLRYDASNVRSITLTWCGLYTFHYCIFFELTWIFTVCLRLTISDRPIVAFTDVARGEHGIKAMDIHDDTGLGRCYVRVQQRVTAC